MRRLGSEADSFKNLAGGVIMNRERRNPMTIGILTALFLVLLSSLVGCENGTLGLKGGSISGTVLDSRTLAGIAAVNITAVSGDEENKASKYTSSDSNGNYHFSGMRADEWTLTYDKVGYTPIDTTGSAAVSVVVVNNENSQVPQVRMVQTFINQYVTIRGTLKDATNGSIITYGNCQFLFGQESFNNRLPGEFTTGFRIPASTGPLNIVITVAGYLTATIPLTDAVTDRDLGTVTLQPETYKVVGRWTDVPGWVFTEKAPAAIFARSGSKIIAMASSTLNMQQFEITGIPKGMSVTIDAEIKGYRMNSPIAVYPNGDFQGTIYQTFSLKNNFSAIMREVRVVYSNAAIGTNDRVGAYCEETGTRWPETILTNPTGTALGTPEIVDLGTQYMPTGYTFTFVGYIVENASSKGTVSKFINDDGAEAQIVSIP